MKFAVAALIGLVSGFTSPKSNSAYRCQQNIDCDRNHDRILQEWRNSRDAKPVNKPEKYSMSCADTEFYDLAQPNQPGKIVKQCLTPNLCRKGTVVDYPDQGFGIRIKRMACPVRKRTEDSAYICTSDFDCDRNIVDIQREWRESKVGNKPVKGNMTCGKMTIYEIGKKWAGKDYQWCLTPDACNGFDIVDSSVGIGITTESDACFKNGKRCCTELNAQCQACRRDISVEQFCSSARSYNIKGCDPFRGKVQAPWEDEEPKPLDIFKKEIEDLIQVIERSISPETVAVISEPDSSDGEKEIGENKDALSAEIKKLEAELKEKVAEYEKQKADKAKEEAAKEEETEEDKLRKIIDELMDQLKKKAWEQKEVQDVEDKVDNDKTSTTTSQAPEPTSVCCTAITASCLSCKNMMTLEEFCNSGRSLGVPGCETDSEKQEDYHSGYFCQTTHDCDKNFDRIVREQKAIQFGPVPVYNWLTCAEAQIYSPKNPVYSMPQKICMMPAMCRGFDYKKFSVRAGPDTCKVQEAARIRPETREGSAYACIDNQDCNFYFDQIMDEYEQGDFKPKGSLPEQGSMTCAFATFFGYDPESEKYGEYSEKVCLTNTFCKGGEWADKNGNGIWISDDSCYREGSGRLASSFAVVLASVVGIYAMIM